jgi:hypothetical protein
MIRRDLLSALRDDKSDTPPDLQIELTTADHEEPTWEVRPAGEKTRRKRIDHRTRVILSVAAAAAVVVNAGAAWSYWRITQPDPSRATTGGAAVELTLRARNDLNRPLSPGGTSNLTVTVTNEYNFPIRITTVVPGSGNIVADDEHREAGCTNPGVTITRPRFAVAWNVPRNTIGAFTIADGLTMSKNVSRACDGAVFTIPVQVSGYSADSA